MSEAAFVRNTSNPHTRFRRRTVSSSANVTKEDRLVVAESDSPLTITLHAGPTSQWVLHKSCGRLIHDPLLILNRGTANVSIATLTAEDKLNGEGAVMILEPGEAAELVAYTTITGSGDVTEWVAMKGSG